MEQDNNPNSSQLSEYELEREKRIQKNEAYLASLGLLSTSSKRTTKTSTNRQSKKLRLNKANDNSAPLETRRSSRIQRKQNINNDSTSDNNNNNNKSEELLVLAYSRNDRLFKAVKQEDQSKWTEPISDESFIVDTAVSGKPYRRHRPTKLLISNNDGVHSANVNVNVKELLQQQPHKMKYFQDESYLIPFRNFLIHKDKISPSNERSVMRQVSKLAKGEGIRYESAAYGWPEGCYFAKNVVITPLDNLVEWMDRAEEAEENWGRDRGNGWLLRHPLKKLYLFQQYCIQNPNDDSLFPPLSTGEETTQAPDCSTS